MVELILAFGIVALTVVVGRLTNKNAALQAELEKMRSEKREP